MRQQFNDGQEMVFADLNKMSARIEQTLFDRVIYELMRRKTDAFFGDSFEVIFSGATSANVRAGLGFQDVPGADESEPKKQPMFRSAIFPVVFTTPDNTNPRIDLVVIKAARVDGLSEARKFKDEGTGDITTPVQVITTEDEAVIQVVAGTPAAGPVAPAIPAGFLLIAECLIPATVGMADQGDITDKRVLLPLTGSASPTLGNEYDRVVGDPAILGVTDPDLPTAAGLAQAGDKILVLRSETMDLIPDFTVDNIELVLKRGVTLTKGAAIAALRITGNDFRLVNGRFAGFGAGGDKCIDIVAAANRTLLERPRFVAGQTENIADAGTDTFVNDPITE